MKYVCVFLVIVATMAITSGHFVRPNPQKQSSPTRQVSHSNSNSNSKNHRAIDTTKNKQSSSNNTNHKVVQKKSQPKKTNSPAKQSNHPQKSSPAKKSNPVQKSNPPKKSNPVHKSNAQKKSSPPKQPAAKKTANQNKSPAAKKPNQAKKPATIHKSNPPKQPAVHTTKKLGNQNKSPAANKPNQAKKPATIHKSNPPKQPAVHTTKKPGNGNNSPSANKSNQAKKPATIHKSNPPKQPAVHTTKKPANGNNSPTANKANQVNKSETTHKPTTTNDQPKKSDPPQKPSSGSALPVFLKPTQSTTQSTPTTTPQTLNEISPAIQTPSTTTGSPKQNSTWDLIIKKLPKEGEIPVCNFKKSLSNLEDPTFGKVLGLLISKSDIKFDIDSIPSLILNKSVDVEKVQDALDALKGRVPNTKIHDTIVPIIFANQDVSSNSNLWSFFVRSQPKRGSILVDELRKSLAGKSNLKFEELFHIIDDKADVELNLGSIQSEISDKSVDVKLILKALDALSGKVSVSDIYDAIWPVISKRNNTESSTAPAKSPSPSTSHGVWNIIVKKLHHRGEFDISELKNELNGKRNINFGQFLDIIANKAHVKLNKKSLQSSVLNISVDIQTIQHALNSLKGKVSVSDVFNVVWPIVSEGWKETSAPSSDNVWRIIIKLLPKRGLADIEKIKKSLSSSKNKTISQILQLISYTAGKKLSTKSVPSEILDKIVDVKSILDVLNRLKGDVSIPEIFNTIWLTISENLELDLSSPEDTWNIIIKSMPQQSSKTINIPKLKQSISNLSDPTFGELLQLISDIKFGSQRVSSSILNTKISKRSIEDAFEPLNDESSVPEVFNAIWSIIFNDWKNAWSPKKGTTTTAAPKSSEDAWKIIIKSVPRRHTINIPKFNKTLSDSKHLNFEQFLQLIARSAGIEINLKLVQKPILNIQVDINKIQNALSFLEDESSIFDILDAIWEIIFTNDDNENESTTVRIKSTTAKSITSAKNRTWNIIIKSIPDQSKINVTKLKKSLLGVKNATFEVLFHLIVHQAHIRLDVRPISRYILEGQIDIEAIQHSLNSLEGDISLSELLRTIWSSIFKDWDIQTTDLDDFDDYDEDNENGPPSNPVQCFQLETIETTTVRNATQ